MFIKILRAMKFKAEAFHGTPCAIIFVLQGPRLRVCAILALTTKGPEHYPCNADTDGRLFLLFVTVHLHKYRALTGIV